jgi:hypothetical protein
MGKKRVRSELSNDHARTILYRCTNQTEETVKTSKGAQYGPRDSPANELLWRANGILDNKLAREKQNTPIGFYIAKLHRMVAFFSARVAHMNLAKSDVRFLGLIGAE